MVKKNIWYIITYILAVLVILLGALFYRQPVLTALLLMMLLLPPISIILCYAAAGKLKITFDTLPIAIPYLKEDPGSSENENGITASYITDIAAGNGQDSSCSLKIRMNVENTGFIPLLNCAVGFTFQNRYYPNDRQNEIVFAAPPKSRRSYDLNFDASIPGLFEFTADSLQVTDLIHMKTRKIQFNKRMKTAILPEEVSTDDLKVRKSPMEEDAENSLTGELTREIRQIREYAPGDKLRDMHWKQTARLDEPMVRDFERMRENFYCLFPVIEIGTKAQELMQGTLSIWYSLAKRLIKQGETVFTIMYDTESHSFEKLKASSEDELTRTVYELYCGTYENFRISDDLCSRIRNEIPEVAIIHNAKLQTAE